MAFPFFAKKTLPAKTAPAVGGTTPILPPAPISAIPSQASQQTEADIANVQNTIAPPAIEVDFSDLKVGDTYLRTLFVVGYPRYVSANWLSPLINFNHSLDIAMYIYPTESKGTLDQLRRRIAEMEAEISTDIQRGRLPQAATEAALEDAKSLQSQLVKGVERFYQFSLYVTIGAESVKELNTITKQVQSTLGSLLIVSKVASLSMEEAFKTTLPYFKDRLLVTRNMDTTALSTTFPFTSSDLSDNKGVLYGINMHNESLVIFDRFSLENANMLVLATSGAGKSYFVKLEILRSFMFDTDTIVIDPENEYEMIAKSVGGNYIAFSTTSAHKINPFQIANPKDSTEDEMGYKYLFLNSLLKIMLGQMSPIEDATLNRALVLTYRQKGITEDPATHILEAPRMEDLYRSLIGMEEESAKNLAARLERYVMGALKGIFDQQSNIDLDSKITVFTLRELADEIRPIVMFIILDYVWTKVRKDLRRRLLVVDEAWYLMRYEDSAKILQGFVKRARKYYLGVTVISQNADDFLSSAYGKAIVTNSALQMLFKQSPAAIDQVAQVFYLSQGERHMLLSAAVGEGLFFAGQNHVAIRVISSPDEHALATSKPSEILERQKQAIA
ncbi:MAG TPA: ATP-binding protein [Patescibacteria group bacterium]|nr:ATP-binding protein [Patescibacteria group bacterium]